MSIHTYMDKKLVLDILLPSCSQNLGSPLCPLSNSTLLLLQPEKPLNLNFALFVMVLPHTSASLDNIIYRFASHWTLHKWDQSIFILHNFLSSLYIVPKIHPCWCVSQSCVHFHCYVVFLCVNISQFIQFSLDVHLGFF